MSAGNQQERLDAEWIVGFVDGEGCFHVAINRMPKMSLKWQVLPEFRVVQHERDEMVLHEIKDLWFWKSRDKSQGQTWYEKRVQSSWHG